MDDTAWVGVAGIVGTLLAAVLAPMLAERMRRESAHREQLRLQRFEAYADLLRATARLADNAVMWSSLPRAELKETNNDELDRLMSRVSVVASEEIHTAVAELRIHVHNFNTLLDLGRYYEAQLREGATVDTPASIKQRMRLGEIASAIATAHKSLEQKVRAEMLRT